jgi:hypothetical protein
MKKSLMSVLLVLFIVKSAIPNGIDSIKSFNSKEYKILYKTYKGKHAINLERLIFSSDGRSGDQGLAYVEGLDFRNGIIEMDIASGDPVTSYLGLVFRMNSRYIYETIYFRPGCCSGTINAIQYMPSLDTIFNWWDYEGEEYGASVEIPKTDWFHVKVWVNENEFKLYVDGNPEPVMHYTDLDTTIKSGTVGFFLGNSPSGYYTNLKVTDLDENVLYENIPVSINYFDQDPPGDSAIVFAPDFISTPGFYAANSAFSPDGKSFYFNESSETLAGKGLYYTKYESDKWSIPVKTEFLKNQENYEVFPSPDGSKFLFVSQPDGNPNLYYCNWNDTAWSEPILLPAEINSSGNEYLSSLTLNNTLYFNRQDVGLFTAKFDDGVFHNAKKMDLPVNTNEGNGYECDPYISPYEDYLIYSADRPGTYGNFDLFISYKKSDGTWTNPKNLGPKINTKHVEWSPGITPDGKYLLFTRRDEFQTKIPSKIYWLKTSFIDSLKNTNFKPYVKNRILDIKTDAGSEFTYTIPDTIFYDDDGINTLTLAATLSTGAELPGWLFFDDGTKTFSSTLAEVDTIDIRVTATDTAKASISTFFRLTVQGPNSIQNAGFSEIEIYPNPASDIINIKTSFSVEYIEIYDVLGNKTNICHINYSENNIQLVINDLSKGIYFLRIQAENKVFSQKLIIK